MKLADYVGAKIRELRNSFGAAGLSQQELARELEVNANTISRWELGSFRPGIDELEKLSHFFSIPVSEFFPSTQYRQENQALKDLISTAQKLNAVDLDEIKQYVEFRIARNDLREGQRPKIGRKPKNTLQQIEHEFGKISAGQLRFSLLL